MAGMIYRKFYPVCNTAKLLQLYVSYIQPLLEYAVPVWNPHTASNSRRVGCYSYVWLSYTC